MARRLLPALSFVLGLALLALPAGAHSERPTEFPAEPGVVPTYRTSGPTLVVCAAGSASRIARLPADLRTANEQLLQSCAFHSIQDAIDAVTEQGSRILLLPGVYREKGNAGPPKGQCGALDPQGILSYEEQLRCPHVQNLIAILGDSKDKDRECDLPVCGLQIEGTGDDPGDVLIDNEWSKIIALRADRADGVYFRNFTVQKSEAYSLYVIETDGFVIDQVVGRWSFEYGFLTFASDHGLYTDCEAYGNGDGGVYPGSAADHHGARPAIEIRRCDIHHNALGISGTAGNSLWVHNNRIHHNITGADMDSVFPDHPGLPQDSSWYMHNLIYSNNEDYYRYWRDGTCDQPLEKIPVEEGVVCPVVPVPIGVGVIIAGGNNNLFAENWIYDNWRHGTMQFGVPSVIRNEFNPQKAFDTSHNNRYLRNHVGVTPEGKVLPNGDDFWWDEQGTGNCWSGNIPAPGREVKGDPETLPDCESPAFVGLPVAPKQALLVPCAFSDPRRPDDAVGCDFYTKPSRPS
jgi:hypothetical protein